MGFEFGVGVGGWWAVAAGLMLLGWFAVFRWHRAGWLCGGLKLAGFTLLALCLLEPRWVDERPRQGENVVAVLVDTCAGLGADGRGAGMVADTGWIDELGKTFQVRTFAFGQETGELEDVAGATFDSKASAMGGALRTVAARFAGGPLAAVIILTDGNSTDTPEIPDGMPAIFAAVPDERAIDDMALGPVVVEQTPFEDAPVTVRVPVVRSGKAADLAATVRIADAKGTELASATVGPDKGTARLSFQPTSTGIAFYYLAIDAIDGEVTMENNARAILVDRGGGPFRVLYVSGRPNWEYKFLRRALEAEPEVDLVALLRVAKREPKFEWRGRAGEANNPLFRGFGEDDDAGYDQPVLIRLGTEDAAELSGGFPGEAAGLFRYHALIVDDLEAAFFTAEQLGLIREFVSQRGGGFLMLGGVESFGAGGYAQSPVADLLPVALVDSGDGRPESAGRGSEPGAQAAYRLTRDGLLEPWVRLRETELAEATRLEEVPPFWSVNPTGRAKPGATVLAQDARDGSPLLASQRFGRGRAASLAVGDLWRWGFQNPELRDDFDKNWRQMVRWLVADVPGRVTADAIENPGGAPGLLRVRVLVRNAEFLPEPEAEVAVRAISPDGSERVLPATADSEEAGTFWSDFRADDPGGYRFVASATDYDSQTVGEGEAGFAHDPLGAEFANLGRNNLAVLEQVASATGGRILGVGDLGALARELPEMEVPLVDRTTVELWHTPWVFLLGIGLLLAEWGIRRARGYA
ncbi:Ig-like domain-containing protein [soil metagenome]